MGLHPTLYLRLSFMFLLFWFLMVVCFVSLSVSCSKHLARIVFGLTQCVGVLTVCHFCDRREGVKFLLLREGWLMGVERWLNGVRNAAKRVRSVSISGDHREQVQGMLTSTFLKRGNFMVLILNGCGFCQWMSVSLARDAYHA